MEEAGQTQQLAKMRVEVSAVCLFYRQKLRSQPVGSSCCSPGRGRGSRVHNFKNSRIQENCSLDWWPWQFAAEELAEREIITGKRSSIIHRREGKRGETPGDYYAITYMHTYIHSYIHTYIHSYIHTYIHT